MDSWGVWKDTGGSFQIRYRNRTLQELRKEVSKLKQHARDDKWILSGFLFGRKSSTEVTVESVILQSEEQASTRLALLGDGLDEHARKVKAPRGSEFVGWCRVHSTGDIELTEEESDYYRIHLKRADDLILIVRPTVGDSLRAGFFTQFTVLNGGASSQEELVVVPDFGGVRLSAIEPRRWMVAAAGIVAAFGIIAVGIGLRSNATTFAPAGPATPSSGEILLRQINNLQEELERNQVHNRRLEELVSILKKRQASGGNSRPTSGANE